MKKFFDAVGCGNDVKHGDGSGFSRPRRGAFPSGACLFVSSAGSRQAQASPQRDGSGRGGDDCGNGGISQFADAAADGSDLCAGTNRRCAAAGCDFQLHNYR